MNVVSFYKAQHSCFNLKKNSKDWLVLGYLHIIQGWEIGVKICAIYISYLFYNTRKEAVT